MKKLDLRKTSKCPVCDYGHLFNISTKFDFAMGVLKVECDHCHAKYAQNIEGQINVVYSPKK